MTWQSHPSAVPLLFGSVLLWVNVGYLLWRRQASRRAPGQLLAAGLVASIALSLGVFAIRLAATTLVAKQFLNTLIYFGDASVVAFLLAYVLVYIGYDLSHRQYAALFSLPVITIIGVITNPLHGLHYQLSLNEVGSYVILAKDYGPLFWLYVVYSYAFLLVSIGLLARAATGAQGGYRRQLFALIGGLLLPAIGGFAHITGFGPEPTPNYMGYGYIGTAVAFSYTVYRHDLFAAVPVARRTAIEQLDEGLITLDMDGVVVSLNDAARRFLGESEPELLGRPSVDALGPFVEPFDLEASAEQSTTVETDAGVFDVTLTPVVRGESPIGNQLLLQNVTERHRREQQLTALNTRLSLALAETDTGVWELDLDTEELIFDEASERLYGYDPGAFPGTVEAFADRVSDTDFAAVEANIEHAIETGEEYRADFRVDHPDGGYRWIQTRGVVQSDADGEPERILGIQTDVTERVVAAQSIEQQRDGLELLNSVVRHDIRNDLQLIDAYAQMLGETENEHNEQHLSVIRRATNNAVDLTTTARELAEVMLQTDPQPEPVALRPVLEAEIDAVRQSYPESEIIIEGSIPDVMVSADELLDAVFRNLLKNAIQHNRQETPGIWVSVDCLDETVEIRIADNGLGVDDAHKETIFGKGKQGLDSDGTGIGLYLVQSLVDRYGGDVWVEDRNPPSASSNQLQTAANESTGAVFVVQLAIYK